MYSMADYFDIPALMDLCKSAFVAMIQPENVVRELVHRFARLHKPIAEFLESYATRNWVSPTMVGSHILSLLTKTVC